MAAGDDQLVLLLEQGHEIEVQGAGRGQDAQPAVGGAALHGRGHGQMGEFDAVIAGDVVRVQAQLRQFDNRGGRACPAPRWRLTKTTSGRVRWASSEICFGIARGTIRPWVRPTKPSDDHRHIGQIAADVAEIVFARFLVQQVRPGQMRFAPAQGQQPAERADIAGTERAVGTLDGAVGRPAGRA